MIIKTECIVLKSDNYRSSSKLVTLYTEELGKLRCIAKGVRQTRTKWGSVLQPMSCLTAIIYYKENKSLHMLSTAEHNELYLSLYDIFEKTTVGYRLLELVLRTTTDNHPNRDLFCLLKDSLRRLNAADSGFHTLLLAFEFRLAELLGIGVTQELVSESRTPFGTHSDRFLPAGIQSQSELSRIINSLRHWNFNQELGFNISKDTFISLDDFFEAYFRSHFEHKYPSKTKKISYLKSVDDKVRKNK